MKAFVCSKYGPPEVLHLKEVQIPIPKKGEIRIKNYTTAVTASDCIIRGFKVPIKYYIPMSIVIGFKKPRKSILGIVFAGVIDSMGADVKSFKIGDQVYGFDRFGFGGYAEYKCIHQNSLVVIKPNNITFETAAALPFGWLLALYYLKKSNIQKEQNVLIYGASGSVGTAAVQIGKYFGARITGVCSATNLELVKSLGADKVLDYTKENFSLGTIQYDLIFNAVGKRKATLNCKTSLTKNGKHITVDDGSPKFHIDDLILLNQLVKKKKFKAVIDRTYPLEQLVQAHSYADLGHKKGNVVITVD